MKNTPLKIGNVTIQPGERITLALPTPELYTCAPIYIPVHVIHGKKEGPRLLVCGALHGDEINGIAICQRLLNLQLLNKIRGTLMIIPTLNVYGMMTLSRNLPDRRDLDGSFPGSKTGSYASRLASLLNEEIFSHITHCIDLHTGEPHISKFPQVKTSMKDPKASELAYSFQAPVIINEESEEGSHMGLLWLLHRSENPIPTISYLAGEALRLNAQGIKMGARGIVRVMRSINMLQGSSRPMKGAASIKLQSDLWLRAPSSGLCEIMKKEGAFVEKGSCIAKILDPFGTEKKAEIFSPFDGVVIGRHNLPILNEGDPILQIAKIRGSEVEMVKEWSDVEEGGLEIE